MNVLVTGATDGIGKQTAFELARRGHRVLVHGRSRAKAERAVAELAVRKVDESLLVPVAADLASLEEVRGLAGEAAAAAPRLEALINNAGVFETTRRLSRDGFELTLAINHLAHFLLTHLLLPQLRAGAPSRVINVSSVAHGSARLDLDDLQLERRYDGYAAYANSKLANVLFSVELAARLAGSGITVNALHPGVITTKLLRKGFGSTGDDVARGAATSVKLATDPALAGVTGKYFANEREAGPSRGARDREAARRLYEISVGLTGVEAV